MLSKVPRATTVPNQTCTAERRYERVKPPPTCASKRATINPSVRIQNRELPKSALNFTTMFLYINNNLINRIVPQF